MSAAAAVQEKRQFGRRPSAIRGLALLPAQAPRPITIVDISDGGARLRFDERIEPPRAFRIEIEGTDFVLQCEVRHQGSYGVGVRFLRPSEGAALNAHFREKQMQESAGEPPPVVQRTSPTLVHTRGTDLRAALRASVSTAEPATAQVQVAPEAPRQMPEASSLSEATEAPVAPPASANSEASVAAPPADNLIAAAIGPAEHVPKPSLSSRLGSLIKISARKR